MRYVLSHILKYDWLLMGAVLLLMILGLVTLFSLSGVSSFPFFPRQILWSAIGTAALVLVSLVDFRLFKTQSVAVFIFYLLTVLLLGAVLLGDFAVRGVEAWFRVGNFFLQPVELAQIVLIILLAKFFSKRHVEIYRLNHLLVSAAYFAVPAFLVLLQPDLGSAAILVAIWISVVIFSGMKFRHLIFLLLFTALLAFLGWNFVLAPYQKDRVVSFFSPYDDPQGASYQMIQSMIAVGSGRIWGKGLGYGSQTHLHFLPEAETDFIFAAFAEEWGFVGVAVILILLLILLWRIVSIGMRASDNFSRLYAHGFATLVFIQSFIHIGMNMGILPVTGLPLPFVSYGGSSLVTLLLGVGILQNIKINSRREIE